MDNENKMSEGAWNSGGRLGRRLARRFAQAKAAVLRPSGRLAFILMIGLGALLVAPSWWTNVPQTPFTTTCAPVEVLSFFNRVHVRCAQQVGTSGIVYFALPTGEDINTTNRFATMASSAFTGGYRLRIDAHDADDGSSFGCLRQDCRPPRAFGIVP
jgi:hypothetical protein